MRKKNTSSEFLLAHSDISSVMDKAEIKQGKKAISLRLDQKLIQKLTKAAEHRGIGYQTMARIILKENKVPN